MPDSTHIHEVATGTASSGFLDNLFESFMPRRQCMNLEADVIWLHVISDALIALAYYSIPIALVYFVRRRRDLQFNWMFLMFAAFILACGTTHVFGIWAIWQPLYRLDGMVKAGTAIISVSTAILLWPLIPKALALPSPGQLAAANAELEREIQDRESAQENLRIANEQLERRVIERTQALDEQNLVLQHEIQERIRVGEERKQLLLSERRARSDAERANRHKDEFLATLSHELRTPLNAIMGWAHVIGSGVDAATIHKGLETIERSVRVQTKLIEDLIDMSRINSGKMRLQIQPIDLVDIVESALGIVQSAAEVKNVRLHKSLPETAPMKGDPDRLQQVIWNLLSNAIKFTPAGGEVFVHLEQRDGQLTLTIRDTGQGIHKDFLPFVFERFRQADSSTTRRFGGLGLGLSIAKHLVDLHGGTIAVSSDGEGKGASFVVTLSPQAELSDSTHPDNGEIDLPGEPGSAAPPDLTGVRVLVIDDESDAREFVRHILVERHAEVELAASAVEGLDRLLASKPDLVICDIGMPDQDGYGFITAVRALSTEMGGDVLAVALTSLAQEDDRIRALTSGFHRHLTKPVEPYTLVALVSTLLQATRNREEKS